MEAILQWGLDCVRLIQAGASPPLTLFMRIITSLGSTPVYLVMLPLVYWCIDEKKGLRLGMAVLISVWLNITLKILLDQPRPFFEGYDPSVGMFPEKLGGFPSGHAQNSLVMWIIIASWGKKKRLFGIAALFCLLIGFSRVYLGVHFPTDVFGGWLIGALILCGYFVFGRRLETMLEAGGFRAGMIAGSVLAFIMILCRPSDELLLPAALVLGLSTGYCLNRRYVGFTASSCSGKDGPAKYLVLCARFVLGIAGMVLLFMASEKLLAAITSSDNYRLFLFLRFAVLALWIPAGAPWLFRFLHLAENDIHNVQDHA